MWMSVCVCVYVILSLHIIYIYILHRLTDKDNLLTIKIEICDFLVV